jgi:hypothetical protein
MATYDMTSSDTAGVGANVLAVPTVVGNSVRTIEAILDIDAMVTAGYSTDYLKSLLGQLF